MPRTTLAVRIERHGPPDALTEREIALADPGPDEVHLRVQAAGVNFADLMMRTGIYATVPPRPYSPGFEAAGTVERVGSGMSGWKPGDRAVALVRHGAYARDLVVPARNLFPHPSSLSSVEAAAIPVAFLTAWVCLHETGHARPGETLLILNAAGGVGTAAVQLGRRAGMRVFGTAGAERKRRFVVDELGAEACFASDGAWERDLREAIGDRGLDVALDAIGGRATASCRRLLGPLGRLVFYGLSEAMPSLRRNPLAMARAWLKTPRFHPLSLIEPNLGVFGVHLLHLQRKEERLRPILDAIFTEVAAGSLRPIVDRTFPLDRAGAVDAHRHIHERRVIGKVILAAGD